MRLWRDKIFSLLLEDGVSRWKPKSTFPCYIVVSCHLVLCVNPYCNITATKARHSDAQDVITSNRAVRIWTNDTATFVQAFT